MIRHIHRGIVMLLHFNRVKVRLGCMVFEEVVKCQPCFVSTVVGGVRKAK